MWKKRFFFFFFKHGMYCVEFNYKDDLLVKTDCIEKPWLNKYCRDERPRYIHWVVGCARGRQITQEQISTSKGIQINGP